MNTPRAPKLVLLIIAVLWWGASDAAAQFVIGRYASEFLSLGAGARALAMGGASVAAPTMSTAAYYNPSALASVEKRHVEFMHASQFDNLFTYDYFSYAGALPGHFAGAVTLLYTRVSSIPMTQLVDPSAPLSDENRVVLRKETGDHELALLAATGRRLGPHWRAGTTAKLLFKTVAGRSAYGLGFDLGAGRTLAKGLEIGLAVHDVTTSVLAWSTGRTEAILPSLVLGGAWTVAVPAVNARVTAAADADGHFESRGEAEQVEAGPLSVEGRFGVEYVIANTVALRGGFDGDQVTYGAGLRLAWLSVNAAFQDHSDLGFTHRISLGAMW